MGSPKDVEDNETPPFEQLASVPVTRRSPVEREKDTDDILTWIRQGKDVADDTTGDFEVIDNLLPKKPLQRPEERAREIEGALDWMRSNNFNLSTDEPSNVPPMAQHPQLSLNPRSPEDRLRDLDRTLNWIRKGKPEKDEQGPTDEMKLIDQLLPKKENQ